MVQPLRTGIAMGTPPGRTGHVSVSYEKYMLVWGGYRENPGALENTYFSGAEVWIYSCTTEKWYLKKDEESLYPPGMSGSAGVVIGDDLYLFGGYGYSGDGCTNSLYKLDLSNFKWEMVHPTGIAPIPVDKMAGWNYKDKLYIFGGFGNPDTGPSHDFQFVFYHLLWRGWTNQFFEYDPKTNHWNRPICTGNLPSARAAHAAAVVKNKVYIFGGRHDTIRMNDLHCLDMDKMRWSGEISVKGPIPIGRSWHSLTAVGNQFLILYGGFSQHNVALSDCWMFDTEAELWTQILLPFNKPRLWHCACSSVFDEVLVYGGCTSNILDVERAPEQATDIVVIRITPQSLFRLCTDKLLEYPGAHMLWDSLPQRIKSVLCARAGDCLSSNLHGS